MSEFCKRQEGFSGREITRREFVTSMTVLGVTTAMSPIFNASRVFAAAPKRGGRLRIAVYDFSTADTLNPTSGSGSGLWGLGYQLKNNLVEEGPGGTLLPELAESWEASADAATWTFKIRKGVEFHNGKSLTAEDVIASINHHRGEKTKSAGKAILSPVKDIKADGKHIVVFTLDSGNADFPAVLTDFHYPIFRRFIRRKIFYNINNITNINSC